MRGSVGEREMEGGREEGVAAASTTVVVGRTMQSFAFRSLQSDDMSSCPPTCAMARPLLTKHPAPSRIHPPTPPPPERLPRLGPLSAVATCPTSEPSRPPPPATNVDMNQSQNTAPAVSDNAAPPSPHSPGHHYHHPVPCPSPPPPPSTNPPRMARSEKIHPWHPLSPP